MKFDTNIALFQKPKLIESRIHLCHSVCSVVNNAYDNMPVIRTSVRSTNVMLCVTPFYIPVPHVFNLLLVMYVTYSTIALPQG